MYITRVLAVVTETIVKNLGLAGSSEQSRWADIFHRWDVDSTQLELARSVIK